MIERARKLLCRFLPHPWHRIKFPHMYLDTCKRCGTSRWKARNVALEELYGTESDL